MIVIEDLATLSKLKNSWQGTHIALVPTMGALHRGHEALICKAKSLGGKVLVSIFVNPLQFGPKEDLAHYPRPKTQDLSYCETLEVDAVFYPTVEMLYPHGLTQTTQVLPPTELTNRLCGKSRPGHFTGVATIVLKLLNLIQPHSAIFGRKDAQQLAVIQRLVLDLNLPVEILPVSTVREPDGLALSSRNQYLNTASDRQQARLLSRLLRTVQTLYQQGLTTADQILLSAQQNVLDETLYPDFTLEYLTAVDCRSFEPITQFNDNTLVLVAAKVSEVRLIDNLLLSETWTDLSSKNASFIPTESNHPNTLAYY